MPTEMEVGFLSFKQCQFRRTRKKMKEKSSNKERSRFFNVQFLQTSSRVKRNTKHCNINYLGHVLFSGNLRYLFYMDI